MDKYQPVITVGSVEGYAKEYNDNVTEAVERAMGFGHDLAWTNKHGAMITSDYEGKEQRLNEKAEKYSNSIIIEDGQKVIIEGREYTTKYIGINFADPIHFITCN